MKLLSLGRHALSICAVAASLAACGGSQPPIVPPGAMPQSRDSTSYTVLYSFRSSGDDGEVPYAGLIDVNGRFYGTTVDGGKYGSGTVFSISPTGKEHVLHSFAGPPTDSIPMRA